MTLQDFAYIALMFVAVGAMAIGMDILSRRNGGDNDQPPQFI